MPSMALVEKLGREEPGVIDWIPPISWSRIGPCLGRLAAVIAWLDVGLRMAQLMPSDQCLLES